MSRFLQVSILALSLLCVSLSANAQYTVRIDNVVVNKCETNNATVGVTIEPDGATSTPLGGFSLTISYIPQALMFQVARAGSFLDDCEWEYFTYRYGSSSTGCCPTCPTVNSVTITALAETNNGAIHPSCYTPTGPSQLLTIDFLVTNDLTWDYMALPLDFYWDPIGSCSENSFSSQSGNDLLIASSVTDLAGSPWVSGYECSGPDPACAGDGVIEYINFHSGSVTIIGEDDGSHRGDINLNAIAYEVSDLQLFSNYFIYGLSVFTIDLATQVGATEMNCDGLTLSCADLVYGIRVLVGDAQRFCTCPTSSPKDGTVEPVASSVLTDTMAFFGAEGWAGKQNIPFPIHITNSQYMAGMQARIVYNATMLAPRMTGTNDNVVYSLIDRGANWENDGGSVLAFSSTPGELIVYMYPADWETYPDLPPGSGNVIQFYFDVLEPPFEFNPNVAFVDEGYYYNLFSDSYGQVIWPTLIDGQFNLIPEPSCPVLFSDNGAGFVQENPLLTACEASDYQDIVTDYYHVRSVQPDEMGMVNFQLKELEDETTYLEEIELLTVDHSPDTKVAASVSGTIMTYRESVAPISAVDHNGVDCLDQVVASDRDLYASAEPGHIILQFPNNSGGKQVGYNLASGIKKWCPEPIPNDPIDPPFGKLTQINESIITVEVMSADGNWIKWSDDIPPRVDIIDEVVTGDMTILKDLSVISVRVSWTEHYATDRVHQLVMTDEQPSVNSWSISESEVSLASGLAKNWVGDINDETLILNKGDMIQFSFATDQVPAGLKRDYIIRATGRYQPNDGRDRSGLPGSFALHEAFPNPFNPSTTITYELSAASNVRVDVINLLGQQVATLVDEYQTAGRQEVIWNAMDDSGNKVASGVYFYRLTTDKSSASKKMILLK